MQHCCLMPSSTPRNLIVRIQTMVITLLVVGCKMQQTTGETAPNSQLKDLVPPQVSNLNVGQGTYFDGTGEDGGGCGVHPDIVESTHFAALNVQFTPDDISVMYPRPLDDKTPLQRQMIGTWNNGLNCGRWVRVTIQKSCPKSGSGQWTEPSCLDVNEPHEKSGATVDLVITDSCQDGNVRWCRKDKGHIDISKNALSAFSKDGKQFNMTENWKNPLVSWEFIKAPMDSSLYKDQDSRVKIYWRHEAKLEWPAIVVTHLPNGIHALEYLDQNTHWTRVRSMGDTGQQFLIGRSLEGDFKIRIVDADDQVAKGYYQFPFNCKESPCKNAYTNSDYIYVP